jgi:hypothetical protein
MGPRSLLLNAGNRVINMAQLNPLKTKREQVRKDSRRVEVKRTFWGKARGALCLGTNILLEGIQALPARPSDNDRMRVKTLGQIVRA